MPTSITVETSQLRKALTAVRPHIADPKAYPELSRVHCTVRLPGPVLHVAATNTVSCAVALVDVVDVEHGELDQIAFDLFGDEIPQILAMFKTHSKEQPEGMGDAMRIDVLSADAGDDEDDAQLVLTDVSGLFPGRGMSLPRTGAVAETDLSKWPNVHQVLGNIVGRKTAALPDLAVLNGHLLAAFAKAQRAYGDPLVMTTHPREVGANLVITCGPAFLGSVGVGRPDEERAGEMRQVRTDWLERLPAAAAAAPKKRGRGLVVVKGDES